MDPADAGGGSAMDKIATTVVAGIWLLLGIQIGMVLGYFLGAQ